MKCRVRDDIHISGDISDVIKSPLMLNERQEAEGILRLFDDLSIEKVPAFPVSSKPGRPRFRTPLFVRWDLTYKCNLQCRHCYSDCSGASPQDGLPTSDVIRILDILDEGKPHMVQILGGEPFVRPDINEIILHALSKSFIFAVNTNGTLLTRERIELYAGSGMKIIQVSLHGLRDEHEALTTVKGSFDKAVRNIEILLEKGIFVSVSCLVSDINADFIFEFIDFLTKLGVTYIQFLTPLQEGRAPTHGINLSPQNNEELCKKLVALKNERQDLKLDLPGFDVDLIDGFINSEKFTGCEFMYGCGGGVSSIRINPTGAACICVGSVGKPLGSVLKEPLEDIMERLNEWRRHNIPQMCRTCDSYLEDCQGACYLRCPS